MALFITHGIFTSLLIFLWREKKTRFTVFILLFIASVLPDIDYVFHENGSGMFSHRGITHSFFFAAMTGAFFSALFLSTAKSFGQSLLLMCIFFLATASHCCLDAMTQETYGVCFFCPFNEERYFFPVTPFISYTSGVVSKGFRPGLGNSSWATLFPEILLVWIPTFAIFALTYYLSGKHSDNSQKNRSSFKPIQIKAREAPKQIKKIPNQKKK